MKKSTLGILAVTVIVVGGGGGCIIKQLSQTPPASQQERTAAPSVPSEVTPTPAPTTPGPSAREGSTPSVSEIVVTKTMDKAGSTTPPAPAPAPTGTSTSTATEKTAGPTTMSPASATVFMPADALNPITFKWTPLVPKPATPVTYRLKVWQLMQGQSGTQAMRTNKPIVTKDVVDVTEAAVGGIYTGPCKPPYLCDFVWNVTTMSAGATTAQTSESASFSVNEAAAATTTDSSGAGTPPTTR